MNQYIPKLKKFLFTSTLIFTFDQYAVAASYYLSTTVGLMTQPASSYYHTVYGLDLKNSFFKEKLILNATYIERPEFKFNGFSDKESGSFFKVGSKLNSHNVHKLFAYVGYGKMSGYIKEISTSDQSSFHISGPVFKLEYIYDFKNFSLGIDHQTLVGHSDSRQLEAKVAWPYNFFMFNLTYHTGDI